MLKNYIIIAYRNFLKQRIHSIINLLGLTTGITCSLLLFLYITEELSYDKFHTQADHIHRIIAHGSIQDDDFETSRVPGQIGPQVGKRFPQVKNYARFLSLQKVLISYKSDYYYEDGVYFADSSALKIFTFPLVAGDKEQALVRPYSVVLTEQFAKEIFGDKSPLGLTLQIGEQGKFTVTGILQDIPANSHFDFKALLSYSSTEDRESDWVNFNHFTYALLEDTTTASSLERDLFRVMGKDILALYEKFNAQVTFKLEPLTSIHLHSSLRTDSESGSGMSYLYIFSALALFILVIASINYTNLASACAATRAKEIGVRKVVGAYKKQLILQFLIESILLTLVALCLSLVLADMLLPYFNKIIDKNIVLSIDLDLPAFAFVVLTAVVIGILGGILPAFFLSNFRATEVLKGKITFGHTNLFLRKALVIFQFTISIVMIICSLMVSRQLHFLRTKNLGFNKTQVMVIDLHTVSDAQKIARLKSMLRLYDGIQNLSTASATPGSQNESVATLRVETAEGMKEQLTRSFYVDEHFIPTLEMHMVMGDEFLIYDTSQRRRTVLVNETLVEHMEWDTPIGKKIEYDFDSSGVARSQAIVVGVVQDFHLRSLRNKIEPAVIRYRSENPYLLVRIKRNDIHRTLKYIQTVWTKVMKNTPYEYTFIDEAFYDLFKADMKTGMLLSIFSFITILIACLGLFGLTAYNVIRKRKEIGIRKALGASMADIIILINKEYLILIGVSVLAAWVLAYFLIKRWLDSFAYHIDIEWDAFFWSTALTFLIAMITVSYHSIKATNINPSRTINQQ